MKHIITILIIVFNLASTDLFGESEKIKSIELMVNRNVDVSHPNYGNSIYGSPKINTFLLGKQKLLIYQARYGGDGDHTPNIVKIFTYNSPSFEDAKLIFQHNLDLIEFTTRGNQLILFRGLFIESLCLVCDGWEASRPESIFKIPLTINPKDFSIKVDLTEEEKKSFLERLKKETKSEKIRQPKRANLFDQLKWSIIKVLNY